MTAMSEKIGHAACWRTSSRQPRFTALPLSILCKDGPDPKTINENIHTQNLALLANPTPNSCLCSNYPPPCIDPMALTPSRQQPLSAYLWRLSRGFFGKWSMKGLSSSPIAIAEFPWISLNLPEFAWICLFVIQVLGFQFSYFQIDFFTLLNTFSHLDSCKKKITFASCTIRGKWTTKRFPSHCNYSFFLFLFFFTIPNNTITYSRLGTTW
jgi:hypothetical protein